MAKNFYSRPCGRGDSKLGVHRDYPIDFYSRPCGRGDCYHKTEGRGYQNFYSRPCGRGDHLLSFVVVKFLFISTHAPAGGAIRQSELVGQREAIISTHAPAGGATFGIF